MTKKMSGYLFCKYEENVFHQYYNKFENYKSKGDMNYDVTLTISGKYA